MRFLNPLRLGLLAALAITASLAVLRPWSHREGPVRDGRVEDAGAGVAASAAESPASTPVRAALSSGDRLTGAGPTLPSARVEFRVRDSAGRVVEDCDVELRALPASADGAAVARATKGVVRDLPPGAYAWRVSRTRAARSLRAPDGTLVHARSAEAMTLAEGELELAPDESRVVDVVLGGARVRGQLGGAAAHLLQGPIRLAYRSEHGSHDEAQARARDAAFDLPLREPGPKVLTSLQRVAEDEYVLYAHAFEAPSPLVDVELGVVPPFSDITLRVRIGFRGPDGPLPAATLFDSLELPLVAGVFFHEPSGQDAFAGVPAQLPVERELLVRGVPSGALTIAAIPLFSARHGAAWPQPVAGWRMEGSAEWEGRGDAGRADVEFRVVRDARLVLRLSAPGARAPMKGSLRLLAADGGVTDHAFELKGDPPTAEVALLQPPSRYRALAHVDSSVPGSFGMTSFELGAAGAEVLVHLGPAAAVRGRIVPADPATRPRGLVFGVGDERDTRGGRPNWFTATVDGEGRFLLPAVPPGATLRVLGAAGSALDTRTFTAGAAGSVIDLELR